MSLIWSFRGFSKKYVFHGLYSFAKGWVLICVNLAGMIMTLLKGSFEKPNSALGITFMGKHKIYGFSGGSYGPI